MMLTFVSGGLWLSGLVFDGLHLYIIMLMSVSPAVKGWCGLVWFELVFISIYYDVDVCQWWVWSGLRWFSSLYIMMLMSVSGGSGLV